jgi:Tetracyclin repressor-like, C-terminal domain
LFDGYQARPHVQRLATWYRLERAGPQDPIDIIVESNAAKVEAISKAQADGTLTDRWSAVDLLGLVLHISGLWSAMTPEFAALVADRDHAHRRAVIVDAVRALLA